jgi:hypothetical protein
MTMRVSEWLRRLIGIRNEPGEASRDSPGRDRLLEEAFSVPSNVHDAAAWDLYWTRQLASDGMEVGFGDMMASDKTFIDLLRGRGTRKVLCVGNGLSSEALVLALYGFDVTILELSRVAADRYRASLALEDHPFRQMPGFTIDDSSVATFGTTDNQESVSVPPMHRNDRHRPQGGGSLTIVSGDLTDRTSCPGPFDTVIERRTVQLFPPAERSLALECLVERLATPGVFVSHQHFGAWRPGDPRTHFAEDWLMAQGFVIGAYPSVPTALDAPRLAQLRFTSG